MIRDHTGMSIMWEAAQLGISLDGLAALTMDSFVTLLEVSAAYVGMRSGHAPDGGLRPPEDIFN